MKLHNLIIFHSEIMASSLQMGDLKCQENKQFNIYTTQNSMVSAIAVHIHIRIFRVMCEKLSHCTELYWSL